MPLNKDVSEHRGKEGGGCENTMKKRRTRVVESTEGSRACDKGATVSVQWLDGDN